MAVADMGVDYAQVLVGLQFCVLNQGHERNTKHRQRGVAGGDSSTLRWSTPTPRV